MSPYISISSKDAATSTCEQQLDSGTLSTSNSTEQDTVIKRCHTAELIFAPFVQLHAVETGHPVVSAISTRCALQTQAQFAHHRVLVCQCKLQLQCADRRQSLCYSAVKCPGTSSTAPSLQECRACCPEAKRDFGSDIILHGDQNMM